MRGDVKTFSSKPLGVQAIVGDAVADADGIAVVATVGHGDVVAPPHANKNATNEEIRFIAAHVLPFSARSKR